MKYTHIAAFAVLALVLTTGVAHAEYSVTNLETNANVSVGIQANNKVKTEASSSASVKGNATSTSKQKDNATTTTKGNASTTATTTSNLKGQSMSLTHQSIVSAFVHSLLSVADRDGGIGTEVRAVAKSQNDSATTTAEAIAEVEGRGALRTFILGSDYKNLGVIRSEMATTTTNIAKLKTLLDKTVNAADRAELSLQIKALEAEQATLEIYVKAHENAFSLLGWFSKLLNK